MLIEFLRRWLRVKLDFQSRVLLRNSSWVFGENLVRTMLNFLRAIMVARILGAELYGTYAVVVAFCMTVQEIFNLNLGTTVIKFGAEFRSENRLDRLTALVSGAVGVTLITATVSVLTIGALISVSYATFIKQPGLGVLVIAYSVAWSTNYFDYISSSMLMLFDRFRLNSLIRMVMNLVEFVFIVVALLVFKRNLPLFFAAVIAARLLNSAIINLASYNEFREEIPRTDAKVRIRSMGSRWRDIRNFTIQNSLGRTVFNVINQGDVLLVGVLTSASQAGYYAIAKKLAFSILRLSDPLSRAIFPQFSRLIAERRLSEIRVMITRFLRIGTLPSVLLLGGVFTFRVSIIDLLFGSQYVPAADSFFALMVVAVIMALCFWNRPMIQSTGRVGLRLVVYIIALLVEVLVALLLYPGLEALGIAISVLAAFLIINISFAVVNFNYLKHA